MEDQSQRKSYKLVWIAGASLSAFIVILGATIYLVAKSPNSDPSKTATSKADATAKSVASRSDVKKSLDDVTAQLKQAAADQAAVKSALADNKNQVKVGS